MLLIWKTLCSAGCEQAATDAVLGERTRLQTCYLQPLLLGPSIPQQPASLCSHPPTAFCPLPSPLKAAAPLDSETRQLGGIFPFSLVTFPYPNDTFHSSVRQAAAGGAGKHDLLGGFDSGSKSHCFRKPCGGSMLLSTTEHSKEGGKVIAEKSRSSFSQQMEKTGRVCSFIHQTAMPCLLTTHF